MPAKLCLGCAADFGHGGTDLEMQLQCCGLACRHGSLTHFQLHTMFVRWCDMRIQRQQRRLQPAQGSHNSLAVRECCQGIFCGLLRVCSGPLSGLGIAVTTGTMRRQCAKRFRYAVSQIAVHRRAACCAQLMQRNGSFFFIDRASHALCCVTCT